MPEFQFADARFDDAAENWVTLYADERVRQRCMPGSRLIYCESLVRVRTGSIDHALELLHGPWTWWRHGRAAGFHELPDGSTSQTLSPVWWHLTRIGIQIFPRRDLPGTAGFRLPLLLSRDFEGTASIDLYPATDHAADGLIVRSRYHGINNHIPFVSAGLATRIHLRAEAGTMLFPFPKGTGYAGLWQTLEAGRKGHPAPTY